MNQVLMVKIDDNHGSTGLFVNSRLIACAGCASCKAITDKENLGEIAQSICIALNVSLVEVNFSESEKKCNWSNIRDILLTRRVMRYRNAH